MSGRPRTVLLALLLAAACASEPSRPAARPAAEQSGDRGARSVDGRPVPTTKTMPAAASPVESPTPQARQAPAPADGGPQAEADAGAPAVPSENRERGTTPSPATAEAWAPRLLEAIKADDPSGVLDVFFPAAAFDIVKAMADPARYHRRLVAWYEEDLHIEHDRFPDVADLSFDRFQMGRCTWQERGSEGNRIPYWSCRHNFLHARSTTGRRRAFEIRVMINWGQSWHITHLGPIRR
ncbi:MAG: hypothetical protein HYY06_13275 [Deltaproteobacteria bacterium]|nr:hypothetical protein [Deltaproteobacteria bacterium]